MSRAADSSPSLIPQDAIGRPLRSRSRSATSPRPPSDESLGPRSLADCCRGMMMRVAPRYADIGDLQVAQHPLFFRTRPLEQLLELEENSPQIRADTDYLWAYFLYKQDPKAHAHNLAKPPDAQRSWRRLYHRSARKTHATEQAEWEALKARVDEDERIKRANGLKVTDRVVPERRARGRGAGGRMRAVGPYSANLGPLRAGSLIDKARRATLGIREIRHAAPAALASAQAGPSVSPFRGSVLVDQTSSSGARARPMATTLPPLPTTRLPMSDHDTGPGYAVMPLAPRTASASTPTSPAPMANASRKRTASAVVDTTFFGGAINDVSPPAAGALNARAPSRSATNRAVQADLAARAIKRPRSEARSVKDGHAGEACPSVAPPRTKPPPSREVDAVAPPRHKTAQTTAKASSPASSAGSAPAVPLSSLFMPKKKRK